MAVSRKWYDRDKASEWLHFQRPRVTFSARRKDVYAVQQLRLCVRGTRGYENTMRHLGAPTDLHVYADRSGCAVLPLERDLFATASFSCCFTISKFNNTT